MSCSPNDWHKQPAIKGVWNLPPPMSVYSIVNLHAPRKNCREGSETVQSEHSFAKSQTNTHNSLSTAWQRPRPARLGLTHSGEKSSHPLKHFQPVGFHTEFGLLHMLTTCVDKPPCLKPFGGILSTVGKVVVISAQPIWSLAMVDGGWT